MIVNMGGRTDIELNEDLLRHLILNSIRSIKKRHEDAYGEIVIACDSRQSWRRDVFPHYKANRRKNREASEIDWASVFASFDKIRNELASYFPYRVILVNGAEADDIIGTLVIDRGICSSGCGDLVWEEPKYEQLLIVSKDGDFKQLQRYSNVKQWDFIDDKFIEVDDPDMYLFEHIVRGDRGDGVPNILSQDNSFVDSIRQKSIMTKKLDQWRNMRVEDFCDAEMLRNWQRNKTMIDLRSVPEKIQEQIRVAYDKQGGKDRSMIMDYMIHNKLRNHMERLNEF